MVLCSRSSRRRRRDTFPSSWPTSIKFCNPRNEAVDSWVSWTRGRGDKVSKSSGSHLGSNWPASWTSHPHFFFDHVNPANDGLVHFFYFQRCFNSCSLILGINIAVYYSVTIFSQIGLSSTISQLLAAVMNTCFAIGSFFTPSTIERFGRRKIMIYSTGGLTICLAVFIGMISSPDPTLAKQWMAVAAIAIYNIIFGYGLIGVCWLYGPEVSMPAAPARQVWPVKSWHTKRSLRCNSGTLELLLARSENGSSASSPCSQEVSGLTTWDGNCGFGASLPVSLPFRLSGSCAPRLPGRSWKRLIHFSRRMAILVLYMPTCQVTRILIIPTKKRSMCKYTRFPDVNNFFTREQLAKDKPTPHLRYAEGNMIYFLQERVI